jgi:hypothetical protein
MFYSGAKQPERDVELLFPPIVEDEIEWGFTPFKSIN